MSAAEKAGREAGTDVGESLAYAQEALSKNGFFHYEELKKRNPAMAKKLAESVQADIDRSLAKFPHYQDQMEQDTQSQRSMSRPASLWRKPGLRWERKDRV